MAWPPTTHQDVQDAVGNLRTGVYNVKDFGAIGNGVADDTAAINAATNAARMSNGRRGGTVYLPTGKYLVSAPINLYVAVSIVGNGWSQDTANYNSSALVAAPGFVGSAILSLNADGNTVSDPTLRPDRSWHWGRIEKIAVVGNGTTGPHGIDPGWNGEAASIENVQIWNCNAGIYLNSTQASATFKAISIFNCNIGVWADNISGPVRFYGLSGDSNTNILKLTGGLSSAVSVFGLKAESYVTGTGDPLIQLTDFQGGLTLFGGWADTNATRSTIIRIDQPGGSTNKPRILLAGFHCSSLYTNLIDDHFDTRTVARDVFGYPLITYNINSRVIGDGTLQIGYGRSLNGTAWDGSVNQMILAGGSGEVDHLAGTGAVGGRLTSQDSAWVAMQWRKNGGNNLAFFGAEPTTRPVLTYSRTGETTASAQIRAALAALGLVTDSTVA